MAEPADDASIDNVACTTDIDFSASTWLFDNDDPRSFRVPVNHLTYTDPAIVRRVYGLARKIANLFRYNC